MRTLETELRVVTRSPLNAETRLEEQLGLLTPNHRFYLRNHFEMPVAQWPGLVVDGLVETPRRFSIDQLRRLPSRSLVVTLECAGNGRALLNPPTGGTQWALGAVGTAEWTGVPLGEVIGQAGPTGAATEVVFEGADRGRPEAAAPEIAYERSLSLSDAAVAEVILAYGMNGEPLPLEHGAPLRAIVPGWYGMASVKWLVRLTVTGEPFSGRYQRADYVLEDKSAGLLPLREIEPRALITEPKDGASLRAGAELMIRGLAWSGFGEVDRVDISSDGGAAWMPARLEAGAGRFCWRRFELAWSPRRPGLVQLLARTGDSSGRVQPLEQRWNRLGYANNSSYPVQVTVQ